MVGGLFSGLADFSWRPAVAVVEAFVVAAVVELLVKLKRIWKAT